MHTRARNLFTSRRYRTVLLFSLIVEEELRSKELCSASSDVLIREIEARE